MGLVKGSHTSYLDLPGYAVSAQVLIVEVELFAAIGRLADVSGGQGARPWNWASVFISFKPLAYSSVAKPGVSDASFGDEVGSTILQGKLIHSLSSAELHESQAFISISFGSVAP